MAPVPDDLTLEQFGQQLAEVRAHYRETGTIDQARVCMNMLATRVADLRLDRCHVGPSTVAGAGRGLFASRDIRAGELITLYPGDALLYWKDGRDAPSSRVCSGVIFGAHVPEAERDADRAASDAAREYEAGASRTISCVGDPARDDDAAYLGHFVNDGATCDGLARADAYRVETELAANADHVTLEGCQLATQATAPIGAGAEIFVTYGEGYWLSHLTNCVVPDRFVPKRVEATLAPASTSGPNPNAEAKPKARPTDAPGPPAPRRRRPGRA